MIYLQRSVLLTRAGIRTPQAVAKVFICVTSDMRLLKNGTSNCLHATADSEDYKTA